MLCATSAQLAGRGLSNNDGCVVARSNEAKALGIEMGAPWHLNKDLFNKHNVIVRSSNYALYGDMSRRVMRILSTFTPHLEVYSIDEAFLNLDGFKDLAQHAATIRKTILQWTGLPVSIGMAPRHRRQHAQHVVPFLRRNLLHGRSERRLMAGHRLIPAKHDQVGPILGRVPLERSLSSGPVVGEVDEGMFADAIDHVGRIV